MPQAGAGVALDVLEQRSAGEDVDRLEAAADPEDRDAAVAGRRPGRRLELVAVPVDVPRAVGRLAVAAGSMSAPPVRSRPSIAASAASRSAAGVRGVERGSAVAPWRSTAVDVQLVPAAPSVRVAPRPAAPPASRRSAALRSAGSVIGHGVLQVATANGLVIGRGGAG